MYLATQGREIAHVWPLVLVAIGGVVMGTAVGTRVLGRLSPTVFRRVIAVLLIGLGIYMATAGSG